MMQSGFGWMTAFATSCAIAATAWGLDRAPAGSRPREQLAGSQSASATPEVWLEGIETYTLPWDPAWRRTMEVVAFPNSFGKSAKEFEERKRAILARFARAKSENSDARAKALADLERQGYALAETMRKTADRAMPLTVVRSWDGINRREVLLIFGKGQRAVADRIKPGKIARIELGESKPGDDMQARRRTGVAVGASSRVPSDFVRLVDAPSELVQSAFGEVDATMLAVPVRLPAKKDPAPGSGVLTISLDETPGELNINHAYPWYAEFKLFELGKDGARTREVRFEGSNTLVAAADAELLRRLRNEIVPAQGRVEVKSPQPWGYEAEIVRWYGVVPKHRLVGQSQTAASAGNPGDAGAGESSADGESTDVDTDVDTERDVDAAPHDFDAAPSMPPEPETPGVPDTDCHDTRLGGDAR